MPERGISSQYRTDTISRYRNYFLQTRFCNSNSIFNAIGFLILENSAKKQDLSLGYACKEVSDATRVIASKELPTLVGFLVM
jgi:hypothetical protein